MPTAKTKTKKKKAAKKMYKEDVSPSEKNKEKAKDVTASPVSPLNPQMPVPAPPPDDAPTLKQKLEELQAKLDQILSQNMALEKKYANAHDNELALQSALASMLAAFSSSVKPEQPNIDALKKMATVDLSNDDRIRTTPPTV